jgi:hypothetical protein
VEEDEDKKNNVKKPLDLEGFLNRNQPKNKVFPNINDITVWKKKHKVDPDTKVFVMAGGYHEIRRQLLERGMRIDNNL